MSVKIGVISDDLDKQMALLRVYPEIVDEFFTPAMTAAVDIAAAAIAPGIPIKTGFGISTFGVKVSGSGVPSVGGRGGLTGLVGWWGKHTAWYMNVVEYGAKAHEIDAKEAGFLAVGKGTREVTFVKSVQHPGFGARMFLHKGAEEAQPAIDEVMAVALDGVSRELAI